MSAGAVLGSVIVPPPPVVSTVGADALVMSNVAAASAVWLAARRIIYVPVYIGQTMTARLVWWLNGATVGTNNVQCGIYTSVNGLPVTRLIANGTTTLSATANAVQSVDVTDTVLSPGPYFLALTLDGTTATIFRFSGAGLPLIKTLGLCQETPGVFGLPATATPIVIAGASLPIFGFATVALI